MRYEEKAGKEYEKIVLTMLSPVVSMITPENNRRIYSHPTLSTEDIYIILVLTILQDVYTWKRASFAYVHNFNILFRGMNLYQIT